MLSFNCKIKIELEIMVINTRRPNAGERAGITAKQAGKMTDQEIAKIRQADPELADWLYQQKALRNIAWVPLAFAVWSATLGAPIWSIGFVLLSTALFTRNWLNGGERDQNLARQGAMIFGAVAILAIPATIALVYGFVVGVAALPLGWLILLAFFVFR